MNSVSNSAFSSALLPNLLELARTQRLALSDVMKFAEDFSGQGRLQEAAALYKTWLAFNQNHPAVHMVYFNFSVLLRQLDDLAGSINAMQAALKIDPMFGPAHINLGRAYEDSGLATMAIQQWQSFANSASETTADRVSYRVMALQHIGRVMENAGLL